MATNILCKQMMITEPIRDNDYITMCVGACVCELGKLLRKT